MYDKTLGWFDVEGTRMPPAPAVTITCVCLCVFVCVLVCALQSSVCVCVCACVCLCVCHNQVCFVDYDHNNSINFSITLALQLGQ